MQNTIITPERADNFKFVVKKHLNASTSDKIICTTSGYLEGNWYPGDYYFQRRNAALEILYHLQGVDCYEKPLPNVSIFEDLEYGQFYVHTLLNIKNTNIPRLTNGYIFDKFSIREINDLDAELKRMAHKWDRGDMLIHTGSTLCPHLIAPVDMLTETI